MKYYPLILGIMDTINEWNDKLNDWASKYLDNVGVGTLVVGAVFVIGAWGISVLNKKQ